MPSTPDLARFLHPSSWQLAWAGGLLGFALGGFFDGILLHQILQWHHLLSGVEGSGLTDIRMLVLTDGLFHALMYAVALAGLWLLWRGRHSIAAMDADRGLPGMALIGFGVWHLVDAILSHWILGIHRIRMDVANPLLWDMAWFIVFGVVFVIAGWLVCRSGNGDRPSGRRPMAPTALALGVLVAGPVAALPPSSGAMTMVLFKPGTSVTEAILAVAAVDGRLVWSDPSAQLWAIELGPEKSALPLYRHGAIRVSNRGLPAGCLDWFQLTPSPSPSPSPTVVGRTFAAQMSRPVVLRSPAYPYSAPV